MMKANELRDALAQFSGTEDYAKYPGGLLLTDGIRFLAENAGCFWLLDVIASYQAQCRRDHMLREVQFWTLKVNADKSALVTCERDEGDVAIKQEIEWTNFPLDGVRVWVEGGVAMLPSER